MDTLTKDLFSIFNLFFFSISIVLLISSIEIVDKNPSLPILIPKIGIGKSPICVIVSNRVPSPP